ncbi:hypothetical protein ACN6AT_37395 (plasmid) [Streptomyces sp. JL4002]|uniref:beta barrel domain-containing protein n=1 Tax=Streptomyces sp. JL4002 TaxID=3404781 RepID=UPI003B28ABD3
MQSGLKDVKVGDTLILVTSSRYRSNEPVTVARLGRTFLYVAEHGSERRERYDRKTGIEDGQHGIKARLYTPEQYDELKQRESLFTSLLEAGIDVRYPVRADLSTDQLHSLLSIVKAGQKES